MHENLHESLLFHLTYDFLRRQKIELTAAVRPTQCIARFEERSQGLRLHLRERGFHAHPMEHWSLSTCGTCGT